MWCWEELDQSDDGFKDVDQSDDGFIEIGWDPERDDDETPAITMR